MSLLKAIETSNQLIEFRDFYLRLNKEKFLKDVEEFRPAIRQRMEDMKTDNHIKAMLPVFQKMSDDYKDPGYLIAITAYLMTESEVQS